MAGTFRPKEVLQEAQIAERAGNGKVASRLYASLAAFLRQRKKLNEGLIMIEKAIRLSENSPRLYLSKAVICYELEKNSEAEKSIELFAKLTFQRKRVVEYAQKMEETSQMRPEIKRRFYEVLLDFDRTTAFAFLGLARAEFEIGNLSRARDVLLEALHTKDQVDAICDLLKRVLEQAKSEDGVEFVRKYQKGGLSIGDLTALLSPNLAEDKHKTVSPHTETNAKDLKTLIRELEEEMGIDLEVKRDSVEPLISEFRKRAGLILGKDSVSRVDMAIAFLEMGLFEEALAELETVDSNSVHYLDAQAIRAQVYLAQGIELSALEVFQACLRDSRKTEPQEIEFLYQIILLFRKLRDHKAALETCKRIEKLDPNYRDLRRIKLSLQEEMGNR